MVDIHHIVNTFYVYKLARVDSVFNGYFYDRSTTFKVITYYQYQPDGILNQFSCPQTREILAYDIGLVYEYDIEGGGSQKILQGCIINGDTIGVITSINDGQNIVNSFELFQNHPIPFNPSTKLNWQSPESNWQTLKVFDVLGNEVAVVVNEFRQTGKYEVGFDAGNLLSGIYFYRLQSGNFASGNKMILVC